MLIGKAMGVPYIDWSHWLPMNSALAVQSERVAEPLPYTRSTAQPAGWQWTIPFSTALAMATSIAPIT